MRRALAEEELELARAFGAPRAVGIALRCLGLVIGARTGIDLLEESAEVLDSVRSVIHRDRGQSLIAETRQESFPEPVR